jgi:protein-S-isoprenylcysteine O-methyltransferase Ste14
MSSVHPLKRALLWGDVAFYLTVLGLAVRFRPHTTAMVVAVVLAAITYPLWVLARVQLGSAFSFRPEARRLVTSGLYSRLRHPVYVFGTLASLSSLLALQIWPILAFGLGLIPITWMRIRREEKVLAGAFGAEYESYRARTWF